MTCPWSEWTQAPAQFCETSTCAWVRQPGNTWSNLGFLLAAAAIFRATQSAHRPLRAMAWILVLMGVGSMLYHATDTRFARWMDWVGMLAMTAYMVVVCARRVFPLGPVASRVLFCTTMAVGLTPLAWPDLSARTTFALLNLACPVLEALAWRRPESRSPSYRWFFVAWALFAVAFGLWTLDARGILCDPDNHVFSGHAAWHLLDAGMFWATFKHFQQIRSLR